MIFVDGAYRSDGSAPPVFHPVPPPDAAHLQALVRRIAERGLAKGAAGWRMLRHGRCYLKSHSSRSQRLRCTSSGLSCQPATFGRTRLRATSSISGTTG